MNMNTDKITPKWNINLNSIKNNETQRLPIDEHDVTSAIKSISNRTPGPSKLRKPYFTNLPVNVIKNIVHLLNCCYAAGIYPKHFKQAEMIFLPKRDGPTTDPKNFRPISLLNFMGKIFGKILNIKLVNHLEHTGIIKESQHGFRKRRSTNTLIAEPI